MLSSLRIGESTESSTRTRRGRPGHHTRPAPRQEFYRFLESGGDQDATHRDEIERAGSRFEQLAIELDPDYQAHLPHREHLLVVNRAILGGVRDQPLVPAAATVESGRLLYSCSTIGWRKHPGVCVAVGDPWPGSSLSLCMGGGRPSGEDRGPGLV
jgi:hypothetical protein